MTRHLRGSALVLTALIVGLAMPPSHAAFPGRNGKIAYIRHEWGYNDQEIYVINPDGSGRKRLTNNSTSDFEPSFSSDGRLIVWSCRGGSEEQATQRTREICTMRPDGSRKQRLTENGTEDDSPSWSPSGRYIAFVRTYKDGGEFVSDIFKMKRDGTGRVRLTSTGTNGSPEWSPDSNLIAFWSEDGVHTMSSDGSDQRLVAPDGIYPSWSPDGQRIAFERGDDIVVVDRDGSDERIITGDYEAWKPAWSPDGRWILFTRGGDDLFKIRPDGTDLKRVTGTRGSSEATEVSPDWQPR